MNPGCLYNICELVFPHYGKTHKNKNFKKDLSLKFQFGLGGGGTHL